MHKTEDSPGSTGLTAALILLLGLVGAACSNDIEVTVTDGSCGDGACQTDEGCSSCAADCGECSADAVDASDDAPTDISEDTHTTEVSSDTQKETCGNGLCAGTETCESCSDDCGACDPTNTCKASADCTDAEVCVGGTCLPAVAYGEQCLGIEQCPDKTVCTPTDAGFSLCLYSDLATGDPCGLAIECESGSCINGTCGCSSNEQCDAEQYCDTTTGSCGEKQPSSSSCLDPSWCLSDACVADQCGCNDSNACPDGEYCETTISLCASYLLPGMACVDDDTCATGSCVDNACACAGDEDCTAGTYCDTSTGSCAVALGTGADCSTDAMCQSGQCSSDICTCVEDGDCGEGETCATDTSTCLGSLPAGAACGDNTQCISGTCIGGSCGCATAADCSDGAYCAGSGLCTPPALLGGACEDAAGSCGSGSCVGEVCVCSTDADCEADSWCLTPPGACLSAKPAGGTCDTDTTCLSNSCGCGTGDNYCCCTTHDDCKAGQYCGDDGECRSEKWGGVPCATGNECKAGICTGDACGCVAHADCVVFHYCVDGLCESQEGMGNACTGSAQCSTGNCQNDLCACTAGKCSGTTYCNTEEGKCTTKHDTGEECAADEQCETDQCVEGICACSNSLQDCYTGSGVQIFTYCNPITQQCTKKGNWGEPCVEDAGCLSKQCTSDGYCACSTSLSWCGDGHFCETTIWLCQPTGGPGDGCATNDQCSSFDCTSNGYCACDALDCGENQFCNEATGLCFPKLVLGTVCASDTQCGSGSCNGLICGCSADGDCPSNQFCGGAPNGTCQGKGAPGDNCASNAMCFSAKCTGNLCRCIKDSNCPDSGDYCDTATGFCVLQGDLGDVCETGAMCQSGRCENEACACTKNEQCTELEFCELTTGFCILKGVSGGPLPAPCNDDGQCLEGNCIEGTPGITADYCGCTVNTDCLEKQWCCGDSVLCDELGGLSATCLPKAGIGALCGVDTHCISDHCQTLVGAPFGQCGCDGDNDCLAGQYCNLSLQTCGIKAELLQPCLQNSDCESEYCILKTLGGPLGKGPSGCGCDDKGDCLDNQVCDTTSHLCGECTGDGDCDTDEFCNLPADLPGFPTPTAGACGDKLKLGNFCAGNNECTSNYCKEALSTPGDSIGFCTCNKDADCIEEGVGEYCHNGQCKQKFGVGAVCTNDVECGSGDCEELLGGVGICQCTKDLHCTGLQKSPCLPEGLFCYIPHCNNTGACVECTKHNHCDSGNYCSATNACANKGWLGAPCQDNAHCKSNNCVAGPLGSFCVTSS